MPCGISHLYGKKHSPAVLELVWIEQSDLGGTIRSSSSCVPSLMFGVWKATCYLRVGDPLRYFLPLKTSFEYAFHTESPKVQS